MPHVGAPQLAELHMGQVEDVWLFTDDAFGAPSQLVKNILERQADIRSVGLHAAKKWQQKHDDLRRRLRVADADAHTTQIEKLKRTIEKQRLRCSCHCSCSSCCCCCCCCYCSSSDTLWYQTAAGSLTFARTGERIRC